jgi:fatty-acid desaturase
VSNIETVDTSNGAIMQNQYARTQEFAGDCKINWITTFFMAAFHIGAVAALFFFSWKALFLAIVLWWISGSLGIGMGYHRLLTHRGYRTPRWVEDFLNLLWHAESRRRAHFLGSYAPYSPPVHRPEG